MAVAVPAGGLNEATPVGTAEFAVAEPGSAVHVAENVGPTALAVADPAGATIMRPVEPTGVPASAKAWPGVAVQLAE